MFIYHFYWNSLIYPIVYCLFLLITWTCYMFTRTFIIVDICSHLQWISGYYPLDIALWLKDETTFTPVCGKLWTNYFFFFQAVKDFRKGDTLICTIYNSGTQTYFWVCLVWFFPVNPDDLLHRSYVYSLNMIFQAFHSKPEAWGTGFSSNGMTGL